MKVIFLDVDGVLNSLSFYENNDYEQNPIDPETLILLKKIVDASGARLVLASSWRGGWSINEKECNEEGKILNEALGRVGLQIMDKTGKKACNFMQTRCREILAWLKHAPEPVESFVILDDGEYDWKKFDLDRFWVQTDFMTGLTAGHISKAMEILQNPPLSVRKLLFQNLLKRI